MEQRRSKKWMFLLPTAALLASLLLLGITHRNFNLRTTWSSEDLAAGTEPKLDVDVGHGPVVQSPLDTNDLSLRLHPEEHAHRESRVTELHWNITKGLRRPDGVAKDVYLINGRFPGPTVEARAGDEVIIFLHNGLVNESTSLHWHGLRIANGMDGVVGVTQCAVLPGKDFEYRLRIPGDQSGTFWYHAHSDAQRADGLFGALIVYNPASEEAQKFAYDEDQVLLVGDWYHRQSADVLESYNDWKNFKIEPAPDSLLLNGRGFFECSRATRNRPVDCEKNEVPHLAFAGRTRLRVANVGALTGFTIAMIGYTATLIRVDGNGPVKPVRSEKIGILYPGERIDLILERRDEGDYQSAWITISLDRENMQFPNMALIDTQQFPVSSAKRLVGTRMQSGVKTVPWIDLSQTRGASKGLTRAFPEDHDETILVYTTISYLTQYEYRPKGFINHTSWTPSAEVPPLIAQERGDWPRDPAPLIRRVEQDHWIELIVNNLDDKGHPFHLHGHQFFVLESRKPERAGSFEQYNPYDRASRGSLNFHNPVKKDTIYVPSMGYVVLKFRAINPGIWLLHCHVLWHEAVGMNLAIQVGPDADKSQREAASSSCGS